ncbi:glutathione S-transferase [Microvirga flocculans]|uniref:Glutathione S-transferase n=1 Tax=Microvirga flocculans TaxID=217168 RepID=A0A7W6IDQ8_9HYPH|nr:glutathione binding-like protein [Microvirga flocculans]MBB4039597.1 glutathione S-transferase [Microvirga flocculans]
MLKLYYSPGACSMAAHIALEETGVDYETCSVLVSKGETQTPEYLSLNPRGYVPLLDLGGERLTEVVAILVHLARRYPEVGLAPAVGSLAEARVMELAAWLTNTLHVAYACLWRPKRFTTDEAAGKAISEAATARIDALNQEIETHLAKRSFAVGETYTFADPYLLVFFRWANRIGLDASSRYPNWTQWARRIEARPSVAHVLAKEGVSLWS